METPVVSAKKVLWVGLVMAIFNAPIPGIIYSLAFMFQKETRREALIVLVWTVVWAMAYTLLLVWATHNGLVHLSQ